jgi:hypothetical protein
MLKLTGLEMPPALADMFRKNSPGWKAAPVMVAHRPRKKPCSERFSQGTPPEGASPGAPGPSPTSARLLSSRARFSSFCQMSPERPCCSGPGSGSGRGAAGTSV